MQRFSICYQCKYKHLRQPTCAAYPEGIPRHFLYGDVPHLEPTEGDHGIQFEPAEDLSAGEVQVIDAIRTGHERRKKEAAAADKNMRPAG